MAEPDEGKRFGGCAKTTCTALLYKDCLLYTSPAEIAVEVYATTLHYAPCQISSEGFRVAVVLPNGTNTEKPAFEPQSEEDTWMTARNKWLLAHPESSEAKSGAHIGLTGKNIDISED